MLRRHLWKLGRIVRTADFSDQLPWVKEPHSSLTRKIPEREFSPAEIQSFLVEHRGSARVAVEKVQEWIDRTRAERSKMARADSFAVSPLIA